jgi:hypothetical protein
MNIGKTLETCFTNVIVISVAGQIPPFTALPEEVVSVPAAVLLGFAGIDILKTVEKVI